MILRHDRPDAAALVDPTDWPAVVTFFAGDGAGTLVAERWILTAAHTAANIPPHHRLALGGRTVGVARVVEHPAEGVDLALVELDRAVEEISPVGLYDAAGEVGQQVILLGRGDYGTGRDGVLSQDQRLRRVTNRVDDIDQRWLRLGFDPPPDCTELEGVGGEGDSGGPALIDTPAGLRIAGVSSWQDHDGPLGTYGCVEHYARVSTHAAWIRDICSF